MNYVDVPRERSLFWVPKLGNSVERPILRKVTFVNTNVSHFVSKTNNRIYYRTTGGLYWKVFTNFAPAFNANGVSGSSSRETHFSTSRREHVEPLVGIISSSIFWWWYTILSNLRNFNPMDIQEFPVPREALNSAEIRTSSEIYLQELADNSTMLVRQQKSTGRTETQ